MASKRRKLADDRDFKAVGSSKDADAEPGTWPERIDQSKTIKGLREWLLEDWEDDDCDCSIEDCPHDPNDEDGM